MTATRDDALGLGALCVRMHDEQGLHVSFTFSQLAAEGKAVAFLGCALEAARRRLSPGVLREIAEEFCRFFEPLPAEAEACRLLGAKPWPGTPGCKALSASN